MFFYLMYKAGYLLANILPLKAAYWLAERFSDIQYFLARKDRQAVAENLSVILKKDIRQSRLMARKVFRNFLLYLVDLFRIARVDRKYIDKRVRVEGLENLEEALKRQKGVIVVTCHIGSWEMGGIVTAMLGYDISAVALNHRYKNINDFFIRQRERKGLKVIQISSLMKRCVSTLFKNGILALAGDRDFTNTGIKLDFFGVPTSIPKGPAILSLKTKAAIVPGFLLRDNRFNYRLVFDKAIEVQGARDIKDSKAIKKITRGFIAAMERHISSHPEQWLVFRRFWETPVDAFVV